MNLPKFDFHENVEVLQTFPRFVAHKLLDQENAYEALPHIAAEFKLIKQGYPQLFPRQGMVDAVINLADFPLGSDDDIEYFFCLRKGNNAGRECVAQAATGSTYEQGSETASGCKREGHCSNQSPPQHVPG